MITLIALCLVGQTFEQVVVYDFDPAAQVLTMRMEGPAPMGRYVHSHGQFTTTVTARGTIQMRGVITTDMSRRGLRTTSRRRGFLLFRRRGAGLSGGIVPGRI